MFIDESDCIAAVMLGPPSNLSEWQHVHDKAVAELNKAREAGVESSVLKEKDLNHWRGNFVAFTAGISYGNGHMVRDITSVFVAALKLHYNLSHQKPANFAFKTVQPLSDYAHALVR